MPTLAPLLLVIAGCAAGISRQAPPPSPPAGPIRHVYREVDGQELPAFVFRPVSSSRSPAPAILLFHGGGWAAGSAEWTFARAERYAQMGLVAIAVEYRLSGGETTPIEAFDDTCHAFRWARRNARRLGIDRSRVAGHGVSAGGQLVAGSCGRALIEPARRADLLA